MKDIPWKARRLTRIFPDYKRTVSIRWPRNMRVEWQRKCPRKLAEQRVAFWVLSTNLMIFFWTQEFGFTMDHLQRHSESQMEEIRNQLRIVSRNILILSQGSPWADLQKIAAQTMPRTITTLKLVHLLVESLDNFFHGFALVLCEPKTCVWHNASQIYRIENFLKNQFQLLNDLSINARRTIKCWPKKIKQRKSGENVHEWKLCKIFFNGTWILAKPKHIQNFKP